MVFFDLFKILVVILFYFLIIRYVFKSEFSSKKFSVNNFKCSQCGVCCRFLIVLTKKDIACLVAKGLKKENFIEKKFFINFLKKNIEGECLFLTKNSEANHFVCSVYDSRPKACQKFPFINYYICKRADSRCPVIAKV